MKESCHNAVVGVDLEEKRALVVPSDSDIDDGDLEPIINRTAVDPLLERVDSDAIMHSLSGTEHCASTKSSRKRPFERSHRHGGSVSRPAKKRKQ